MSGYLNRSIRDILAKREYLLQSFLNGHRTYFDNKEPIVNECQDEKEAFHTEDKVVNRVHVFTTFPGEIASDGRNNKHTTSVITKNTDSFHGNQVIHDNKESVKRLEDTSGQGYCKYYFQTPFSLEINVDRSNESPGFKNNEEDEKSKENLSLRFNDIYNKEQIVKRANGRKAKQENRRWISSPQY